MKKYLRLICIIIFCILPFTFAACEDFNDGNEKEETTITRPIENISLNINSKAITIGDSLTLNALITPTNTDDSITWSSSNENILTVNNGVVNAVGIGAAGITAKAKNGNIKSSVSFKVMSPSNDIEDINKCKVKTNSAILTITNECYNTFLGITTNSTTQTFTATIFKQSATTYYFITGYEKFKKIDGYEYQKWTAIDYNGKKYEINSIQYEKNLTLGANYSIAVGSINAYNLGVLPISSQGIYYNEERLFVKDGSTFTKTSMNGTVSASSPVESNLMYRESLYGSPVLDSDFNFVGFIIRKNAITGHADFTASWHMERFIQSCGL